MNSEELTESRWWDLHNLLRGWRWTYKGKPVGKWADENKIVWKEEKSCVN